MRLSDILSKPLSSRFEQVEGFLGNARLKCGKQKKISVGIVALTYFCKHCDSDLSFCSGDNLFCIGINNNLVSIDCALKCPRCSVSVPVWFLVESKNEACSLAPEVRVLKRSEKLSDQVLLSHFHYGDFSELLERAERAYHDGLGAGAIVYLRKIFEGITVQTAQAAGIATKTSKGKHKPFKDLLKEVDVQQPIIPKEFSENGYRLFGELSDVIHGSYDEQLGLQKYEALHQLVVGILDNVNNSKALMAAISFLNWDKSDGGAK